MEAVDRPPSSNRGDRTAGVAEANSDGGMKVPPGIEEVVHAVPSSIPPSLFERAREPRVPMAANVPRPVAKAPPPLPSRPTKSTMVAAPRVEVAGDGDRATIEVTVPEVFSKRGEEEAPKPEAPAPYRRPEPSSFPFVEKTLILGSSSPVAGVGVVAAAAADLAPPAPPAPALPAPAPPASLAPRPDRTQPLEAVMLPEPSSLDAVVTHANGPSSSANVRVVASNAFDLSRPTVPSLNRRRKSRATRNIVVALVVSAVVGIGVVALFVPSLPRQSSHALANSVDAQNSLDRMPELPAATALPAQASLIPASVAPTPLPPPRPATRASESKSSALATAETGVVKTDGATPGRRIFVDQRTVGQTPEAVSVRCGIHRIRIGSAGKTLAVDVPCGGEVSVSDR
ncbi:hypothetical protein AKJ09_10432 [Labilithrix luteola]|uniref:PEGA domain-containing protein n=1 Tax=Labilithrix luteola TaxID=1391654 RepID=A0A0K1QDD7_9BACT|nr:hypothetical protein [Labilithrix luteola]AKV03769.1 hypothetical protein AKJ09_10432 [Labilithrix luteola]